MILNLMVRDVSSVGSERCFDRAEVTGSSPVRPTSANSALAKLAFLFTDDDQIFHSTISFTHSFLNGVVILM